MKCKKCGYDSYEENDIYCRKCGFTLKETNNSANLFHDSANGGNKNSGTGKNKNKSKSILTVTVACAVIICCVLIVCIVFILSKGTDNTKVTAVQTTEATEMDAVRGTTEKRTEPVNDAQQGDVYENKTEKTTVKQEEEDYYDHERTPEISAGTRCRVDSYLDGSRSVYLRATPNYDDKMKASAGRDNYVTVIEDYYGGEFIKISLVSEGGTYKGWLPVECLYVVPDDEGIMRTELSPGTTCIVTYYSGLHLWKKPREDEERRIKEGYTGIVPHGEYVQVIFQYNINDNNYVFASYNGKEGWLNADYVEAIQTN